MEKKIVHTNLDVPIHIH